MTVTEGSKAPPFDMDILDPRLYDDPWEAYRWLRNNAPIWWDERNQLYVVSRHEDVSHISRLQELYSAAQGVRPKVLAPMSIISMDDPEHTRQRRLVSKALTPRMVRQLSDHIRDLSNQIIDEISAKGACDFVGEIAIHVPLIVIAELMGLDPDQRQDLYRWSDAMMAGDGHTDADDPVLRAMAVFDILANNADRKGGHCLAGDDGRLWAVDNGLTFHCETKLRTVIWEFGGQPIPDHLVADLRRLADDGPPPALKPLLDPAELSALARRAAAVADRPAFPVDHTGRRYPWPLV